MSVVSATFNTVPGSFVFTDPLIVFVRILGVKREGIGLERTLGAVAGNRQFIYYLATSIRVSPTERFITGEKIWILYEA